MTSDELTWDGALARRPAAVVDGAQAGRGGGDQVEVDPIAGTITVLDPRPAT